MPSEYHDPYSGQEQEYEQQYYERQQPQQMKITGAGWTVQQRKIDPMGILGRIFAILGTGLVALGATLATVLGIATGRGIGFFFLVLAGLWVTGTVFLLTGLSMLFLFRTSRSAMVVERYLAALARQDYAGAFQELDPQIRTGQNVVDRQTWFTRQAQAYDEQGSLRDYRLRAFQINPGRAVYRIRAWRGEGPYLINLKVEKRTGSWKITGFDRF